MLDYLMSNVWGWLGLAGIVIVGCVAVAVMFPRLRGPALAVAGAALAAASIYAKGQRDRAALERRRKDEAVRKVREKYDEIERRPDPPSEVEKRLKRGKF